MAQFERHHLMSRPDLLNQAEAAALGRHGNQNSVDKVDILEAVAGPAYEPKSLYGGLSDLHRRC